MSVSDDWILLEEDLVIALMKSRSLNVCNIICVTYFCAEIKRKICFCLIKAYFFAVYCALIFVIDQLGNIKYSNIYLGTSTSTENDITKVYNTNSIWKFPKYSKKYAFKRKKHIFLYISEESYVRLTTRHLETTCFRLPYIYHNLYPPVASEQSVEFGCSFEHE